jgi:hypothetical protein
MASMSAAMRPEAGFPDALAGPDGTGDPVTAIWRVERFSDALTAPTADVAPLGPGRLVAGVPDATLLPVSAAVRARVGRPAAVASAAPSSAGRSTTQSGSAYRAPARPRQAAVPMPTAQSATATAYQQAAPGQYAGGTYAALQDSTPQYSATRYARPQYSTTYRGTPQSATAPAAPLGRTGASRPPAAPRSQVAKRRSRSGLWSVLVFLVIILVATGLGAKIVDAIGSLIQRWTG